MLLTLIVSYDDNMKGKLRTTVVAIDSEERKSVTVNRASVSSADSVLINVI